MASLAPRLRQRRKAARPQELLEAALTLFVDKGLAATRTDDVARLAGVSKGTLYLYYASKDELFKAVVHTYLVQVIAEGTDLTEQFDGNSAALLRLLVHTWWARVGSAKASGLVPIIMAESAHFPELAQFYVDHVIEPTHRLLGRAVQRGIDRGEFRPVDTRMAVLALIAPVHFLVMHQHSLAPCAGSLTDMAPETYLDMQLDLLLNGLTAPPRP
ncbi:TetR family transcriptional regulator [Aquabacterium olei]|uniref:TetR family transcriptional regulator n=1 Tax=Aquabacterium olei TaxID=1296669 RepID=A0A2U8FPN8_9BURK|nr:TetR family transcriptional regulator [Aquabacterium olei]